MPEKKSKINEALPNSELVDITPEKAIMWLDAVPTYQRKIDERHVNKLIMAIQRNEWRLNGAAIVFNEKGDLIDGQHRLTAIYKSGKTVQSIVVTGVSKDDMTFASLGDSKTRMAADFIQFPHATVIASVLRTLWFVENKLFYFGVTSKGSTKHKTNTDGYRAVIVPPIPELVKMAKKYAEEIEMLVEPLRPTMKITKTGSFCVFLQYYFNLYRPMEEATRVATFMARVGDGIDLKPGSPMLILRKRSIDQGPGIMEIPRRIREALLLKALNAYLDGLPMDRLMWNPDREPYPPLRGYDKNEELVPRKKEEKTKEDKSK